MPMCENITIEARVNLKYPNINYDFVGRLLRYSLPCRGTHSTVMETMLSV